MAFPAARDYLERFVQATPRSTRANSLSTIPDQQFGHAGEPPRNDSLSEPGSMAPDRSSLVVSSTDMKIARSACRSLALFGVWGGWGLTLLGLLAGLVDMMQAFATPAPTPAEWARTLVVAGGHVVAYLIAGAGAYVLSRLTAAAILAYIENFARASRCGGNSSGKGSRAPGKYRPGAGAANGITAAPAMPRTPGERDCWPRSGERSGVHNGTKLRALLHEFETEFRGDRRLAALWEDLAAARQAAIQEGLAQLEAARNVNDPDRVLELYQVLAPSLASDARGPLASELASWFLSLIHRRLRTGKIQADVVRLAARFAETFATTVEGASVHAALPTLRRSVGLCPRCAQPYIGIAEACPRCLGGGVNAPSTPLTSPDSAPAD